MSDVEWNHREQSMAADLVARMAAAEGAGAGEWVAADPVGRSDIARRLGVAQVTVTKWRERHQGFPAHRWVVSGRPVWEWAEVEEWASLIRPPGRPVTTSALPSPAEAAHREEIPDAD